MAGKRPPSPANVEIATWLTREHGLLTTPRAVRTWRQIGWVAPAIVEPQGYALPTLTTNPPEAFEQALAVARVLAGKRRSPYRVTLGLFVRGHPVSADLLRVAYLTYFEKMRTALAKVTWDSSEPFDAGEQLAVAVSKIAHKTKQGRYMLRRARDRKESSQSIITSALTVVFTGMFGGSVQEMSAASSAESQSALDDLHSVTGMSGFVDDQVREVGSIVASHEELRSDNVAIFEYFTLDALSAASQTSNLEALIEGRDHALILLRFMTAFARSTALSRGPATAYGLAFVSTLGSDDEFIAVMALLVTVLNAWLPGRLAYYLPLWEREADRHEALVVMLEGAPRSLRRYLGTNSPPLPDLPMVTQERLVEFADGFKKRHPDIAQRILQPMVELQEVEVQEVELQEV